MTAEEVVARQVGAFNAHDMDSFLATYHPGCVISDGRGEVLMTGHDEIRASYREGWSTRGLQVEVLGRLALGDWVVDREHVTEKNGPDFEAIAVYRVGGGVITSVRLLR